MDKSIFLMGVIVTVIAMSHQAEAGAFMDRMREKAAERKAARDPSADMAEQSIQVGGVTRTYYVHTPAHQSGALPVVLIFHGGSGKATGIAKVSGMNPVADREGFLAVYPQGINNRWNDSRPGANTADDVGFIRALITHLESAYAIDGKRIYAAGISNGGMFTQRLACELDNLAGGASIAANLPNSLLAICHPHHPVPMVFMSGTADPFMPYNGGNIKGGEGGAVLSAEKSAQYWANNDHCGASSAFAPLPDKDPSDGTTVQLAKYASCAGGAEVDFYRIENGGHTWPGGEQYAPKFLIGKTTRDINASEILLAFFSRH